MKKFKFWQIAVIFFIISLFCEIFIFNFRAFELSKKEEIKIESFKYGSGIELSENGNIKVRDSGDKFIEISDINKEVKNIYLDIERTEIIKEENKKTEITVSATDEANKLYFALPKRVIVKGVEKSKYINLNLSGESEKLKITFNGCDNTELNVNKISINKKVPFRIGFLRLFFVYALFMIIYILIPSAGFYNYKINRKSFVQKLVITVLVLVNTMVFCFFTFANPLFNPSEFKHHKQYNELTQAIIDGHFYLDETPPEALNNMENPYDYNLRRQTATSKWDTAYFEGKYYVYFGITPVLVFYLPAKLIFDIDFSPTAGILISVILFMAAVLALMKQIIKKWFKDTPFLIYVILSFLFINSSGALLYVKRPDFYSLPIVMAMTLCVSGLYFWFKAIENDNKIKPIYLFLGSLCMALVAGCRPQMLLASFFAVPLFFEDVFIKRRLFSKDSILKTVLFVIPFIIFAAFIMYYNYARFGSVFDFGANYNLTTNDMTKRGFRFGRIPLGIFMYLFQPYPLNPQFPFIGSVWFYTNYMGTTIREMMFGGIMFNHIILVLNLFIFNLRKKFIKKRIFSMALMGILFSFVIVIADTQMAGILLRYTGDFAWFMFLSLSLIVMTVLNKFKNEECRNYFLLFLGFGFISSMIYNASSLFFTSESSIINHNPELYYSVMHSVQFWL